MAPWPPPIGPGTIGGRGAAIIDPLLGCKPITVQTTTIPLKSPPSQGRKASAPSKRGAGRGIEYNHHDAVVYIRCPRA